MKLYVAIEATTKESPSFGAFIPDLPGCMTQADSMDEIFESAKEAAMCWIDAAFDSGITLPKQRELSEIVESEPEYNGMIWGVIDVDLSMFTDKTERINICLSRRVINRLDAMAQKSGSSRSGYIAQLVMSA